jgi:predicted nucleic acid-binding protein
VTARYLADTSAVSRIFGAVAAEQWQEATEDGVVAICDPVELEFLRAVPTRRRSAMRRILRDTYLWCAVPENVWDRAIKLQDELADASQHTAPSPVDLVIAVTATHHRMTVLHDDGDYEVISRMTGLSVQRVTA